MAEPPQVFPSTYALDGTGWQGWLDQTHTVVLIAYFGALRRDPSQGVVLIQHTIVHPVDNTSDTNPRPTTTFVVVSTPTRSGAARVVAARGEILTIATAGGDVYTVDATTGVLTPAARSA